MPVAPYRVFAVRYAQRTTTRAEVFYHDHGAEPIGMDYFVWAVTNGEHTVVVDLGFTEPVGVRRGRTFLRSPVEGLALVGVDAVTVEHVVVSHFHYDHTGHHAAFPHARFVVQDKEMAFYTGRYAAKPAFRRSIEPDDVLAFVRYAHAGRVRFVDGEEEVVPGVHVHWVGGHTAGSQIVTVPTARGRAVLAADAAHYYEEVERDLPFLTLHDLPGMYAALDRVRALADAPDLIVPGHDPLVMGRLRPVTDGIVEL